MTDFYYSELGKNKDIISVVLSGRLDAEQCDYVLHCVQKQIEEGYTNGPTGGGSASSAGAFADGETWWRREGGGRAWHRRRRDKIGEARQAALALLHGRRSRRRTRRVKADDNATTEIMRVMGRPVRSVRTWQVPYVMPTSLFKSAHP